MARSKEEVETDLSTVRAALQEIIKGERITFFQVGSGEFTRVYKFSDITYENLKGIEAELLQELASLETNPTMTFRTMTNIPLVVTKFRR